ncbi:MAG TPA: polysaccharide deacetylase family protein [Anaerolineaceae bacterium]|nr:polysaccharide deacetylase family protein [Anaerolineaceae bacterium]
MNRFFKISCAILTLITGILITGCTQLAVVPQAPLPATMTPFQPQPPTATLTSTPTATATATSTPFPTLPPTEMPSEPEVPADTQEPAAADPVSVSPEEVGSGAVTVPILLYHHVSDTIQSQYSVTTAALESQMNWLYENGYQTITISDLADLIREGGTVPGRPVIITFDDGYLDLYENAYPILSHFGFAGTAFIIGDTVDTRGNLSSEQLQEMISQGWEIGSHSMHHTDLTLGLGWEEEIVFSKSYLEDKLGVEICTFAYPYGEADSSVLDYTYSAGYTSAVGLGSSVTHDLSTLYFLDRKEVKSWYTLDFFEEFMPWSG